MSDWFVMAMRLAGAAGVAVAVVHALIGGGLAVVVEPSLAQAGIVGGTVYVGHEVHEAWRWVRAAWRGAD